ncbi:hypothetical protein Egran_01527 [Elaphomyces granulatus]|uniref:HNH nuclease domain-containing protein n=1 Tax=Elaphomyces granulatus TaxID=519963 RepID=A0A232M2X4_9EURO|nr:hypothetical protein Egran_01527 [Elaphomyces granulatus]
MSGPSEEFSNTERISLIHGLEKRYGKPVATEAWACLWLSDLEKLRQFVDGKRTPGWAISLVFREGNLLNELVKPWVNRKRISSTPSSPRPSVLKSPVRPTTPTRQPIISSWSSPMTANNEPPRESRGPRDRKSPPKVRYRAKRSTVYRHESRQISSSWTHFLLFDGQTSYSQCNALATFEYLLVGPGCPGLEGGVVHWGETDIFENLLTFAPTVHLCWDSCEFALKPIRTERDKKSMEVKFYWMKHRPRSRYTSLVETPDLPSDSSSGRGDLKFWDCLTERKICSGDTITVRTDDPVSRPLPSQALLKLRWHLNRIVALSGASEISPDPHQQDDDEDDGYSDVLVADWTSEHELIDLSLWNPDGVT